MLGFWQATLQCIMNQIYMSKALDANYLQKQAQVFPILTKVQLWKLGRRTQYNQGFVLSFFIYGPIG
jgi:hypothetical protein